MKIAINYSYGGFDLKESIIKKYGFDPDIAYNYISRTDLKLIELIESGVDVADESCKIKIVSIPDKATDWTIIEYDGAEDVIYVLDGKIHWAKA